MAMFITFFKIYFWAVFSNLRSSNIKSSDSEDLPMIPSVLIDRFINLTSEEACFRSRRRELYFEALRSLLICMLDSNPKLNSKM